MENQKLDEILMTALGAVEIIVMNPRITLPDGRSVIDIDKIVGYEDFMKIADAYHELKDIPELKLRLELRLLEMKRDQIAKQLSTLGA